MTVLVWRRRAVTPVRQARVLRATAYTILPNSDGSFQLTGFCSRQRVPTLVAAKRIANHDWQTRFHLQWAYKTNPMSQT